MKFDIPVEGTVRRVTYSEKDNQNGGKYRNGTVVVKGEFDKIEVELEGGSSDLVVSQLKNLHEGEKVRLLVGVASGEKWTSPARFYFLEDLTPRK